MGFCEGGKIFFARAFKQQRQLSFKEAVMVFFEPLVLVQLLFNDRIALRLSFRGRHRTVAIADILGDVSLAANIRTRCFKNPFTLTRHVEQAASSVSSQRVDI